MKKIVTLLIILGCVQFVSAQQKPQYTQYLFNNYILNPAFAGIENYVDVKLGHRRQWTGIDGAPVSSYVSVNAPIGENFLNGGVGSGNPYERSYTNDYMAAEPHHGVGLVFQSDKAGIISLNSIGASYAYHLGLSPRLNLAVGVTGGFSQYGLNTSLITTENAFDPAVNNGGYSRWSPDVAVGVVAYSGNYFIGASVQQLLPQRLFNDDYTKKTKTVPHFFFTSGVRLYVSDDISITPSVLLKIIQPVPVTFDVNAKMAFRDKFWIGGSYRKDDSFGALLGINLSSLINVGYSYDINTSGLNSVSNGSHEIVLGIMLNNRYQVKCPQHGF